MHTADIVLPSGAVVAQVTTNGYGSYSVPGVVAETRSGKRRAVHGCRDAREALRVAKQVAKLAGRQDAAQWRLRLL